MSSNKLYKSTPEIAILLLNMGGPVSLDAVRPFLYELFKDPNIINLPAYLSPFQRILAWIIAKTRSEKTIELYRQIGGASPIVKITDNLANSIQDFLYNKGIKVLSTSVMRYTEPSAQSVINSLETKDIYEIILFSQYPYYSFATSKSSLDDFIKYHKQSSLNNIELKIIDSWGMEDFYLNWWVDKIKLQIEKISDISTSIQIIFSAHGLPVKYIENGDIYLEQVTESMNEIERRLIQQGYNIPCHLSFQSKVGPVEWLRPYTDDKIKEISESAEAVIIVPIGFVSDHIETLYEIDILYRHIAEENGIKMYSRIDVPNADADYVAQLSSWLLEKMELE